MPPGTQDAERLDSRFTDEDADAAKGSLLDSDDDEEEIHACLHTGIEPLGVLTISTHGRGDLLPGSVKVTSDPPSAAFCALASRTSEWPGWESATPAGMPSSRLAAKRGESAPRLRSITWEQKRWWRPAN